MSFLFGGVKSPQVTYPSATIASEQEVKESETKKIRAGVAGKKTLLTGPQGLLESAPIQRKYLLGE